MTNATDIKTELKACPFCGGEFQFHDAQQIPAGLFIVLCEDCDATGPLKHTAGEAADAWNVRSSPPGSTE